MRRPSPRRHALDTRTRELDATMKRIAAILADPVALQNRLARIERDPR